MKDNPHFESLSSWKAARNKVSFLPQEPVYTAGNELQNLSIYVMDYKKRMLSISDRSLEAHYGDFVFSQEKKGKHQARYWVINKSYGVNGISAQIAGHEARTYELGPEVPPEDIDGRSPAVVTWYDGDMYYLIASDILDSIELLKIAESVYDC